LQGEAYTGRLLQYSNRLADAFLSSGAHVLGRWDEQFSGDATLSVLSYWNTVRRSSLPATANSDTFNFEATHQFFTHARHRVSSILTYTRTRNEARGRVGHNYDPVMRTIQPDSFSVADEFAAVPDRLTLAAGLKAEHNDFSGLEWLPSARLAWTPTTTQTGWLAVSRGLQTPSISDYDLTIDVPGALRVLSLPNRSRGLGEVTAFEAGWRYEPMPVLTFDAAIYFNSYDHLQASQTTFDPIASTLIIGQTDLRFGETHGGELAAVWQPTSWRRLRASYGLLRMHLHVRPGSDDATGAALLEGSSPRDQWQLMSVTHLGGIWTLTGWLRHVGGRPAFSVPRYLGLDVRLTWRLSAGLEMAISGKDLLDPRHLEFTRSPGFPARSEVPRSVLLEVSYRR